jgi:hypothetical protein
MKGAFSFFIDFHRSRQRESKLPNQDQERTKRWELGDWHLMRTIGQGDAAGFGIDARTQGLSPLNIIDHRALVALLCNENKTHGLPAGAIIWGELNGESECMFPNDVEERQEKLRGEIAVVDAASTNENGWTADEHLVGAHGIFAAARAEEVCRRSSAHHSSVSVVLPMEPSPLLRKRRFRNIHLHTHCNAPLTTAHHRKSAFSFQCIARIVHFVTFQKSSAETGG